MSAKKKVFKAMAVNRVRLNPEQAVLSCCASGGKLELRTAIQCLIIDCASTASNTNASSS